MTLPIIGAALGLGALPTYRDWLFEKDRDLELQDFIDPGLLASGDWAARVDAAKPALDEFGGRLGIHGPIWGLDLANPDPDGRAVVTRRCLQGLEICEALGATHMVIHSPYTTWDGNHLDLWPNARASKVEAVHETLRDVVRRAEDIGKTLVIENIEDTDPMDRVTLAKSFGSTAIQVSLDTGHAAYAHGCNGAPPVDRYVMAAGAIQAHVHLQDADGYADRHWNFGEGSIPWAQVFRALGALSSNPRLVLELRDKAGIPASMRFLEARGLGQ